MTKSYGETCAISKENMAAMLALIGKEKAAGIKSPTAIVMLEHLEGNLKIMFDKLCSRKLDFALVRMGNSVQLDDYFYEYGFVPKEPGMTKIKAMAQFLNTTQQQWNGKPLTIEGSDETSEGYEFVVGVNTNPW